MRITNDMQAGRIIEKPAFPSHHLNKARYAGIGDRISFMRTVRVLPLHGQRDEIIMRTDGTLHWWDIVTIAWVEIGGGGAGVSDHALLTNVTADQHHAQSHTHASHTGIGANDHHAQIHAIGGADHTGAITSAQHGIFAAGAHHTEYVPLSAVPGGELGGTYAVPTVDANHGGTHAIGQGGTGQTTAQLAINALSAVSGATDEHVLTKDTATGNAIFKAVSGGSGISPTIVDVKGDLIVATAADTVARKAAGANDTVLTADSTQSDGLRWVISEKTLTISVKSPAIADDIVLGFFFEAITVREVQAGVRGSSSPSVTIHPKHNTDRSAAGTALLNAATAITNTTTGQNLTSFTDNTLVANSWLWLEYTAIAGVVDELYLTIRFTYD